MWYLTSRGAQKWPKWALLLSTNFIRSLIVVHDIKKKTKKYNVSKHVPNFLFLLKERLKSKQSESNIRRTSQRQTSAQVSKDILYNSVQKVCLLVNVN